MPVVPSYSLSNMPRKRGDSELIGVRRWLQKTLVGDTLDEEEEGLELLASSSMEKKSRTSTIVREPALSEGSGNDLGKDLLVARWIADKFFILVLLDESLRHFYGIDASGVAVLKGSITESILGALRSAESGEMEMSLEAHRGLSEEHLCRLRDCLHAAVLEHCEATKECGNYASAADFADQLSSSRGMPLSLLPRKDFEAEVKRQAEALQSKGGDDSGVRVLPGGVELAPMKVPLKRRREMFACLIGTGLIPGAVCLTAAALYYWRRTWPFLVPYLTYAWIVDKSPWKGGMKSSKALRGWALWKHWAAYFPASLIKSDLAADFSGKRPVLMGYHPHGILSFGCQLSLGTDAVGWSEKFPHLTPRVCTLNLNLTMPFLREIIGRLGAIPADQAAIKACLKPGNAVVLVVGGSAEALDTKPGEYVLTLARRKGFFRLALQHGVDLVPVFGFGENDLFEVCSPSSILRVLQLKMYKILSFSMPIFYGRGVFTYNMGMLPFRRPLTAVVGKPIRCEQVANPTQEQIDELKEKYISALRQLHQEWAPRLEPGRASSLMIL